VGWQRVCLQAGAATHCVGGGPHAAPSSSCCSPVCCFFVFSSTKHALLICQWASGGKQLNHNTASTQPV
jgi:hypothetical protein